MARRRYISTNISTDDEINALLAIPDIGEFACLLYTWMIPHADDDASITGKPFELMLKVIPGIMRHRTINDVIQALESMEKVGLIRWNKEEKIIYFPTDNFYAYQNYISEKNKRISSEENPLNEAFQENPEEPKISQENPNNLQEIQENPSSLSPSPSLSFSPSISISPNNTHDGDFESFWKLYPNKAEKSAAEKCFYKRLKEGVKVSDILLATKNYVKYCEIQGIKYKNASTFLGPASKGSDRPFNDYLNPDPSIYQSRASPNVYQEAARKLPSEWLADMNLSWEKNKQDKQNVIETDYQEV